MLESQTPQLEKTEQTLRVVLAGEEIAWTDGGIKVSVASDAPRYFFPAKHVRMDKLHPSSRQSHCTWFGRVAFFHLIGPRGLIRNAVWFYPEPNPGFEPIRNLLAFYSQAVDEAWIDNALVSPRFDQDTGGWDADAYLIDADQSEQAVRH